LRVAIASGAGNALDYAEWVGAHHPSDRMRLASFAARAVEWRSILTTRAFSLTTLTPWTSSKSADAPQTAACPA
jgi:hypothetical protein